MKKTLIAVALAVVFMMALAVPAFAQSMSHSATYEMDGTIDFFKQAGHLCNTGAQYGQTIEGTGEMSKVQNVTMVKGKITMDDANDFIAGETDLTVTSVILLCAPPKYTYEDAVVSPAAMYRDGAQPKYYFGEWLGGDNVGFAGTENYWDAPLYDHWTPVSGQIWAVQVQADPGFSGNLHQDFEAAYGPYTVWGTDDDGNAVAGSATSWSWPAGPGTPLVGASFVGDYFMIEQMARTSQGTVQRFIDVSSPWSGAYLHEDMSVVGKSEISEGFEMLNLPRGAEIVGLWYDIF